MQQTCEDDEIDEAAYVGLGRASAVSDVEEMWLASASHYRLLSAEDEQKAATGARICACCRDGRQALVQHNLLLIPGIAKRWKLRGTSLESVDLWQHGVQGLMKAAVRFDPARGRFTTCATWWIRQAISRAMQEQAYLVREPAYVQQERVKAFRAGTDYPRRITLISLDTPVNPHMLGTGSVTGEETIEAHIADEDAPDPQEEGERSAMHAEVQAVMCEVLTPRQIAVLGMRYSASGATLEACGARLGITRERVRQIEQEALDKLRKHFGRPTASIETDDLQKQNSMVHSLVPAVGIAERPEKPPDSKLPIKRQRPAPSVSAATTRTETREPSPTIKRKTQNEATTPTRRRAPSQKSASAEVVSRPPSRKIAEQPVPPSCEDKAMRLSTSRDRRRSTSGNRKAV